MQNQSYSMKLPKMEIKKKNVCIIPSPSVCQTETVEEPIDEDAEAAEEPEKEAGEEEAEVEEEEEDKDKDKPKTKKVGVHKVVGHMVIMNIRCILKYYCPNSVQHNFFLI